MAKTRSPNYPAISLREAIDKAQVLLERNNRHKMTRDSVVRDLGYKSLNGASMTILSALIKYGLLEGPSDSLRISDDAVSIIVDEPGSQVRAESLRRAATNPSLFADLQKAFPGDGVPSEATLESHLVKMGFTRKAAGDAIRSYRDTFELVSGESNSYSQPVQTDPKPASGLAPAQRQDRGAQPLASEHEPMRFTLSGGRVVRLIFSGPSPTQSEIDELMDYLKVSRRTLPVSSGNEAEE